MKSEEKSREEKNEEDFGGCNVEKNEEDCVFFIFSLLRRDGGEGLGFFVV